MADIATIFHWPPSVTDVMPLPAVKNRGTRPLSGKW
ncbi:TPA: GpE family phage tail protein [Escherichia coli]|nr:GpE family phage tail protein [Escherichia coli]HCN7191936.1 GpE family phage tail protein [Escherichia coli]HCN7315153.1 GpE family phage tail protein [Escherichia coli]HCO0431829.1 GpE family phage tail protein [Escherichia coli]HCO0751161.1 GpE family phage tail protein [Escherichia coli]